MSEHLQYVNPFLERMGISLTRWESGFADFEMPIQAWHMNRNGALQGGVVATLVDAACGYAGLYSPPGAPLVHGVTITLNVNYVSSATSSGVLFVKGKKIGGGRKIFFSEAQVLTEAGVLIASGQASFKYRTA